MSGFTVSEVNEPILNSPFEKPSRYWYIMEGEAPVLADGRRPSIVFPPRDQKEPWKTEEKLLRPCKEYPSGYELVLVNLVRERLETWKSQGYPGVSRTTLELIQWWTRDGREKRLFFAQLEAALTIVFLTEARADFLQGIEVPRDDPRQRDHQHRQQDDDSAWQPLSKREGLRASSCRWHIDCAGGRSRQAGESKQGQGRVHALCRE